jgi:hypothetical protein
MFDQLETAIEMITRLNNDQATQERIVAAARSRRADVSIDSDDYTKELNVTVRHQNIANAHKLNLRALDPMVQFLGEVERAIGVMIDGGTVEINVDETPTIEGEQVGEGALGYDTEASAQALREHLAGFDKALDDLDDEDEDAAWRHLDTVKVGGTV